jgi:hypothetical protein
MHIPGLELGGHEGGDAAIGQGGGKLGPYLGRKLVGQCRAGLDDDLRRVLGDKRLQRVRVFRPRLDQNGLGRKNGWCQGGKVCCMARVVKVIGPRDGDDLIATGGTPEIARRIWDGIGRRLNSGQLFRGSGRQGCFPPGIRHARRKKAEMTGQKPWVSSVGTSWQAARKRQCEKPEGGC